MEKQHVELTENVATSRRRLLSSLLAGGAFAAAAPMLASRASAADETTATTVAPPNRDAGDNNLLNALAQREAQMVATYAAAVKVTKDKNDIAALSLIQDHHLAYQHALVGYLGNSATKSSSSALANASGNFSSDASQLAALEAATMNQHIEALNTLNGLDAATLVASIITMEARHSAALALVSGVAPLTAAGN